MGARQLEAGDGESPAHAARADDDLFSLKPQPALGFDGVRIGEARGAGVLVDGHSQGIDLAAQGRMRTHIVDDLAHAREQPGIIEHRLAHGDAVLTQLSSFADQPGGMGQGPHRDGSVVGCHAAKFAASYEDGAGAQVRGAEGGKHTRRSGANNDDVKHRWLPRR